MWGSNGAFWTLVFEGIQVRIFKTMQYCRAAWQAGDMEQFTEYFRDAKRAGLGVTLHIAEVSAFTFPSIHAYPHLDQTSANPQTETLHLLSFAPDRLGHATFLNDEAKDIVLKEKICIEICLSSNLLYVFPAHFFISVSFVAVFYSCLRKMLIFDYFPVSVGVTLSILWTIIISSII